MLGSCYRRAAVAFLSVGLALATASGASAHPMSPALLQLVEQGDGIVRVTWRQSKMKLPGTIDKKPVLPDACQPVSAADVVEEGTSRTAVWDIDCGPAGLVALRFGIQGLGEAGTDGLIRVQLIDGRTVRGVVSERTPYLIVPERESPTDVAVAYGRMGIEHILGGLDHLLFVFGLLLLVPALRPLAITVTAFTAGHSVTLSLAVLGWANVPPAIVEPVIAFTVYLLAVEIARGESRGPSLLGRYPWAMAMIFGLLHGLGFAGALREVGLPADEIPLTLFSFNVGIELGQIAFLLAVGALRLALGRVIAAAPAWTVTVPAYAMGSLAALWMFERVVPLFGS